MYSQVVLSKLPSFDSACGLQTLLNRSRRSPHVIMFVALLLLITLFLLFNANNSSDESKSPQAEPLDESRTTWKFAIVSDMDQNSYVEESKHWQSFFKEATLIRNSQSGQYSIQWDKKETLTTKLNEGSRAMELSTLTMFNNHLYACDDRTGVVWEVKNGKLAIGTWILMSGNGQMNKGFKCEWSTVKDNKLWIGSFGKEFSDSNGAIINEDPMWVKIIDENGRIEHINWKKIYDKLRHVSGTAYPGYLYHEAIEWNEWSRQWYILPRKASTELYDEKTDERKGSNFFICSR